MSDDELSFGAAVISNLIVPVQVAGTLRVVGVRSVRHVDLSVKCKTC